MTYDFVDVDNTEAPVSQWNFIYSFALLGIVLCLLILSVIKLQIIESADFSSKASSNEVDLSYIYPNRGVITDRDGVILAENVVATKLILHLDKYFTNGTFDEKQLVSTVDLLDDLLGEDWFIQDISATDTYSDPASYVLATVAKLELEDGYYARYADIQLISDLNNDQTIAIKSKQDKLLGIEVDESNKRNYPFGKSMSHILGYTSIVTAEDLDSINYLGYSDYIALNGFKDVVGRLGIESVYDEYLIGQKGVNAVEKDALGNLNTDYSRSVEDVQNGQNLQLSISSKAQIEMDKVLIAGVKKHKATGAVGIIQDVETGELIVMSSVPSYDNNAFVGGISQADYDKLLNDNKLPLLNRTIGAQLPPGSTFKTLTAVAALSAGAIDTSTIYVSRSGYTFSNGAPFQEYQGHAYGAVNVVDALKVSSNIFFCETIRNWDIDELVPYYQSFGIGDVTGVDLVGESAGRIPSPEVKIELANTPGITWLDPIWYPEGDGCNTVIGQGTTLVTPLQMVNWISALANGGTLLTPHLGVTLSDNDTSTKVEIEPIRETIATQSAIKIVQEGMWNAVNGTNGSIFALRDRKVEIAAKTGTAEFGALNSEGIYEHRHAWVTGFFPYDNPKYSFVVLLEDGGESYYSAQVAAGYLDWFVENVEID